MKASPKGLSSSSKADAGRLHMLEVSSDNASTQGSPSCCLQAATRQAEEEQDLEPGHERLLKSLSHGSKGDVGLSRVHVLREELQPQLEQAGVAVPPGAHANCYMLLDCQPLQHLPCMFTLGSVKGWGVVMARAEHLSSLAAPVPPFPDTSQQTQCTDTADMTKAAQHAC